MVTAYVSPMAPFDVTFLNRLIYPDYTILSATLLNPPNSVYYDSLSIKIPVFGRPSASSDTHYSFFVFTPCNVGSISEEAIEGLRPPLRLLKVYYPLMTCSMRTSLLSYTTFGRSRSFAERFAVNERSCNRTLSSRSVVR
jgi:hypothetical protein